MPATAQASIPVDRELRFVARLYRLRLFGLALGFFCAASALYQNTRIPRYGTVQQAATLLMIDIDEFKCVFDGAEKQKAGFEPAFCDRNGRGDRI